MHKLYHPSAIFELHKCKRAFLAHCFRLEKQQLKWHFVCIVSSALFKSYNKRGKNKFQVMMEMSFNEVLIFFSVIDALHFPHLSSPRKIWKIPHIVYQKNDVWVLCKFWKLTTHNTYKNIRTLHSFFHLTFFLFSQLCSVPFEWSLKMRFSHSSYEFGIHISTFSFCPTFFHANSTRENSTWISEYRNILCIWRNMIVALKNKNV